MSSSDESRQVDYPDRAASAPMTRRAALRGFGVSLGAAALLAGCADGSGLRPIYGSLGSSGPSLEQKLTQVGISHIPGRSGQIIRNDLIFHTTGGGAQRDPAYTLEITIKETSTSTLVARDGNSAAQIYNIDAAFQLVRIADKQVILRGVSQGRANYERYSTIVSNVRAGEDAQARAAKTIATDIKSRLSLYLGSTSS